jgi:hypothetical protein
MVSEWQRNLGAKKYELSDGTWDLTRQHLDFYGGLSSKFPWYFQPEPIGGTSPRSGFVAGLTPEAFVAHDKKGPIRIQSARVDRGPRRIVFVVENGKDITPAGRKIEAAVITHILSKARPEDSFALLTARGPSVDLRFGSSREAIRAAAEQLASTPQGKSGKGGVLDALLQATSWFQPPQAGDSILVMTMGLERKRKASFSEVRAAVAAGGVRVFAFQLGFYMIESVGRGVPALRDSTLEFEVFGRHAVFNQTRALAEGSGGSWVLEDTEEGKQYKLTDDRLRLLQGAGEAMYMEAAELYLLQLARTGPNVVIRLSLPVLSRLPWVRVEYPRYMTPCSSPATPTPAQPETTK